MGLPALTEEEMAQRQQELSARIAGRRGAVRGPFRVWPHSPQMCERAESLGAFARFDCSLPGRLRELTLLMAARNWDAQYSWNAHVHQAIEAGIPQAAVKAITEKREAVFNNEADQAFYQFCKEILEEHFVTDATFAAAQAHFGNKGLVDTIGALGNFTMLGMCLKIAFLAGEKDAVLGVRTVTRAHELLPGSHLEIVPGAPHSMHWETPEPCNAAIARLRRTLTAPKEAAV